MNYKGNMDNTWTQVFLAWNMSMRHMPRPIAGLRTPLHHEGRGGKIDYELKTFFL